MILNKKAKAEKDKIKNKIWNLLWNTESIKNHFLGRIRGYNPNVIINACTGGSEENGFRKIVTRFLQRKSICVEQIYEISHPSSWNIPEFHRPDCFSESADSSDTTTSASSPNVDTTDAPDDNSEAAPENS